MKPLSPRQREFLAAFMDMTEERGYPPTIAELYEYMDVAYNAGPDCCFSHLIDKGYIAKDDRAARGYRVLKDMNDNPVRLVYTHG